MSSNLPVPVEGPERGPDGRFKPGHKTAAKFKTPEQMLESGLAYVQWCADNPRIVRMTDTYQGAAFYYDEERRRIPSMTGWAVYEGVSEEAVIKWLGHKDPAFRNAALSVRGRIRAEQVEGGADRTFHPMIASRLAGLAEKREIEAIVQAAALPPEPDPDTVPRYHPDDKDCQGPLYTKEQIERGVKWTPPAYELE